MESLSPSSGGCAMACRSRPASLQYPRSTCSPSSTSVVDPDVTISTFRPSSVAEGLVPQACCCCAVREDNGLIVANPACGNRLVSIAQADQHSSLLAASDQPKNALGTI